MAELKTKVTNASVALERSSTIFLQTVVVTLGIGALVFMLWEPTVEGVNAHATTLYEVYFDDPFLAYAYTASIAFFVALYKAFRLLGYIEQNKVFSQDSMKALRTIKYCAICLIGFIVVPLAYLLIARPGDDIAGGVAMGLCILFASVVVAAFAAVFERLVQRAVDIKSENDLRV